MGQCTLLQSNLLEIIFENCDKEYGAYTLRRSYNKRLLIALLSMVTLSLLLCLLFLNRPPTVSNAPITVITISDAKPFNYHLPSKAESGAAVSITQLKKANQIELPPRIINSININNCSATPIEITPSLISANILGVSNEHGRRAKVNMSIKDLPTKDGGVAESKINKLGPVDIAEITPRYPGGIKALLNFLKKNLRSPKEIEG